MLLNNVLRSTKFIKYPSNGRIVDKTVADEFKKYLSPNAIIIPTQNRSNDANTIYISIADEKFHSKLPFKTPAESDWIFFRANETGGGELVASKPHLLYTLFCSVNEEWKYEDVNKFLKGKLDKTTFRWQRPLYDIFLTQTCRTARGWDRESYIRELARLGYSHVEVNGLATPMAFESNVPGEVLHRFFTYCPALDQFVESSLNKGTYPIEYLEANLNLLKLNASYAEKYGLTPGLLCFEPRAVPETLLQKYPMLRGARVDHPFRSFRPRFNLSIAHPRVREHYGELMRNLAKEVPSLGYIAICSNDSGAGFEHTGSLYVGRNGGAYLIREWKSNEEIAKVAGKNVVRFLKVLRDAASEINPDFRVIIRIDPFWAEKDTIEKELDTRLDIEAFSSLVKGLTLPYHHPRYKDVCEIGGTIYHNTFDTREGAPIKKLRRRGVQTHIAYSHGPFCNFDPLLGIPFPWLTYEKLKALNKAGVEHLAHSGGIAPTTLVPWPINQEVFRCFQLDKNIDIDKTLLAIANRWVGEEWGDKLVELWRLIEAAIRAYPVPVHLYSMYGSVWYRLWVRPLVPDIEKIPEAQREYYEKHMCSTAHNPNRVDLMKDVLFDVTTQEKALRNVERIDKNLWKPFNKAVELTEKCLSEIPQSDQAYKVFFDLSERLKALKCCFRTHRNVAAWIAGVHGYLESDNKSIRKARKSLVRDAVLDELENTKELLELWENSPVEFMIVSAVGETDFIYGDNFGELLKKRLKLMQGRENDEPYIDPDFMWKKSV
jgi:hypothetical protein